MKISLTNKEVEEALLTYLGDVFKKPISSVELDGYNGLDIIVEFGEEEETTSEPKKKRTRKTKAEEHTDGDDDEPVENHYANLPQLTKEEHAQYIKVLSLLLTNPDNCNKQAIQEIVASASDNLLTVIEANTSYQDFVKLCEKEPEPKITPLFQPQSDVVSSGSIYSTGHTFKPVF